MHALPPARRPQRHAVLADQAVDLLAAVLGGVERLLDPSGQQEVAAAPRLCKQERVH